MFTRHGCACEKSWSDDEESAENSCENYCCLAGERTPWCFVKDEKCEGEEWGYCSSPDSVVASSSAEASEAFSRAGIDGHDDSNDDGRDDPSTQTAWAVQVGPCTIDQAGCLLSPNFPREYSTSQKCEISVRKQNPSPIVVETFLTEEKYDYLTVNSKEYSGEQGPEGVVPRGPIVWTSDYETPSKGWKLCLGGPSSNSVSASQEDHEDKEVRPEVPAASSSEKDEEEKEDGVRPESVPSSGAKSEDKDDDDDNSPAHEAATLIETNERTDPIVEPAFSNSPLVAMSNRADADDRSVSGSSAFPQEHTAFAQQEEKRENEDEAITKKFKRQKTEPEAGDSGSHSWLFVTGAVTLALFFIGKYVWNSRKDNDFSFGSSRGRSTTAYGRSYLNMDGL